MKTVQILACVTAAVIAVPKIANAWDQINGVGPWPGGNVSVTANTDSFTTSFPGTNLTHNEARQIISAAYNVWKERTGANLNYTFVTDTTQVPLKCQNGGLNNHTGVLLAAVPGCRPGDVQPDCPVAGVNQPYVSGGAYSGADICFFGGQWFNSGYFVKAQGLNAGKLDLVGLLTHEFGHSLGLDHSFGTVMADGGLGAGNTDGRYPWGDDYDGIRALYPGGSQTFYYRNAFGPSPFLIGGETALMGAEMHVNAAWGWRDASTPVNVVANTASSSIFFNSFAGPNLVEWRVIGGAESIRPPGIAGNSDAKPTLFVAAWANKRYTASSCPTITVAWSSNLFANVSGMELTDCTVHDPAVAFDRETQRFILIYTSKSGTAPWDNWIQYRTAPLSDITNWTAARTLGNPAIKTLDAPAFTCAEPFRGCVLNYVTADTNVPVVVSRLATVNDIGGTIHLWGSAQGSYPLWKTQPAGRAFDDTAGGWLQTFSYADDLGNPYASWFATDTMNGTYRVDGVSAPDVPVLPPYVAGSPFIVAQARHRPSITSAPIPAIFYVR